MGKNNAVDQFLQLSKEERFKGWPLVSEIIQGPEIPYFGSTISYDLETGNGVEKYTSIIRSFGWAVVFGLNTDGDVITLCQWKPGLNCASWELPPGGIGKLPADTSLEEITKQTEESFLKETGYGNGGWSYLGYTVIESGKYRGAGPDDHGLFAHMFLVENLEKMAEARNPNPNEIIETVMVPLDEFRQVLESGLFVETSAVVCAYKALQHLGKIKWA
jgi:hypothetical protein